MSDLENNFSDDEYDEESEEEEDEEEEDKEVDDENVISIDEDKHIINKIIPDELRISSEVISLYEMTEAIGIRAAQIENGAQIFVDYSGLMNNRDIAKKEFFERKSPLIVRRLMHSDDKNNIHYYEYWKINEMTFPINERERQISLKM